MPFDQESVSLSKVCDGEREPQEKSMEYLERARTNTGDRIAVYITDAEKYGEWSEQQLCRSSISNWLKATPRVLT